MSEEALEKTSGVLPEAWYDLIGRVVPGAVAVFTTVEKLPTSSNQLGGLVIGLVVFYVAGIFLDVFSELTIGRLRRHCRLPDTSGLSEDFWFERGRLSPSQWQVVSKMNAEADLFKALAAFFGLHALCGVGKLACSNGYLGCKNIMSVFLQPITQPIDLSFIRIMPILPSVSLCMFCLWAWQRFSKAAEARRKAYAIKDGSEIISYLLNE